MREISFYQRQKGAEDISWVDVSAAIDAKSEVVPGLSHDQALARFHVLDADGNLVSGGRAFAKVWEELPRFRPFARLFRFPPLAWALERTYNFLLKFRPHLQAMARKRQSARNDACLASGRSSKAPGTD